MKCLTLLTVYFSLLIASVSTSYAVTWHSANQATVAWNAVTTADDGTPIDPAQIRYRCYTKTPQGVQAELGQVTAPSYTVTLSDGQKIYFGAKTERVVNGVVESESTISWSDDAAVCLNGVTFGIKFFKGPGAPRDLR